MWDRPRGAIQGAWWCLAALAVSGFIAHLIPSGEALDARVLNAFTRLREYDVDGVLDRVVHLGDPLPYLFVGSAIVLTALARQRPRLAITLAVILVAAPLTAEIIKELTAHARSHSVRFADHISNASWPSGHTTGAMTAALCAVMAAPRNLRPLVAVLGGAYALLIGYTVIALVWHFPSDVIAAYLLSMSFALGGLAVVRRWPDRVPAAARAAHPAPGLGAAAVAAGVIAMVGLSFVRPGQLLDDAAANTTLFAAGAGIAALTGALALVLVRTMRDD
jgi:membrane-associated phospholipid phosphatase